MRKLAVLFALLTGPAFGQIPNGTINAPIYATGYISQVGGIDVTTNILPQPNHPTNLNIYTTSAISGTWSIKLPNPAFEGQMLAFNCGAAVTTVSVTSSDGSSLDPSIPISCGLNGGFALQFDQRSNIWRLLGANTTVNIPAGYVTFTQSGTGAVTTTVDVKLKEPGISIADFGGVDDGSTDNSTALTNALNALPNSGGTILFPYKSTGVYAFASAIVIGNGSSSAASTKQNIFLKGIAPSAGSVVSTLASPSVPISLKYTGSVQAAAFVTVQGPIVWGMDGLQLDCNSSFKCNTGLYTVHAFQSLVQNVNIINWLNTGIRETAFPTLPSGVYVGASNNRWKNIFVSSKGTGVYGTGWDIGISSCTLPNCYDVSTSSYDDLIIQITDIAGGGGILLRGADNLTFKNVFTYPLSGGHVGTNARGVYVLPPTGNAALPSEITFISSPLVGGVYGASTWACDANGGRGITFSQINDGDMTNPSSGSKPIPTTWNNSTCIHGASSTGSSLDDYQARTLRGGVQYYGVATLIRDMVARTAANSASLVALSSGTLPAYVMRAYNNPTGIANTYTNDRKLRIHAAGIFYNNTGGGQTANYQMLIGGTSICSTSGMSIPTGAAYGAWSFDATFSIKNGGTTTATLDGSGALSYSGGSLSAEFADCSFELGGAASATSGAMISGTTRLKSAYDTFTIDMTSAQTLATQVTLGTASANFQFTQNQLSVELQ